jgi:hypothetical protein
VARSGSRPRQIADELERVETIPGVGRRTAEVLLAEFGADVTRFRSVFLVAIALVDIGGRGGNASQEPHVDRDDTRGSSARVPPYVGA